MGRGRCVCRWRCARGVVRRAACCARARSCSHRYGIPIPTRRRSPPRPAACVLWGVFSRDQSYSAREAVCAGSLRVLAPARVCATARYILLLGGLILAIRDSGTPHTHTHHLAATLRPDRSPPRTAFSGLTQPADIQSDTDWWTREACGETMRLYTTAHQPTHHRSKHREPLPAAPSAGMPAGDRAHTGRPQAVAAIMF